MVRSMNMVNLSSALVEKEQIRQALGFAFAGCFDGSKGRQGFVEAIKTIREKCPNLSKHLDIFGGVLDDEFDADLSKIDVEADKRHLEPRATQYIPTKNLAKNDGLIGVENPRNKDRDSPFMTMFIAALKRDYNKKSIMFSNDKLQWARKMSWRPP